MTITDVDPSTLQQVVPTGYILCSTPRTGSTLLCSLLSSTHVLGYPESYFREPDEDAWARRFALPTVGQRVRDYQAFVQAARDAATTANGVFAARIMWGSIQRMAAGLEKSSGQTDRAILEEALGRLTFVQLTRDDVVAQAVSWARAEQTGYWQHGDTVSRWPEPDLQQMTDLVGIIRAHTSSWRAWFASNGIEPRELSYEQVVAEPRIAVEGIAARLQVDVPADWRPPSTHVKQADETNERWGTLLRAALARDPE